MRTYLVGGAVRDSLLGIPNEDRDFLVVGATREDMLAKGYSDVGEDFPVFLDPATGDQYALARVERKNGTGYKGFDVEYSSEVTLEEDLFRRDLTINAMAQDLETGVIEDPYGGKQDLEKKVLRHVSTAFSEDPLRVVRFARFYARFTDFSMAEETVKMCQEIVLSGEMETLSTERYWAELEKVFEQSTQPGRFFEALHSVGALKHVSFFHDMFGKVIAHDLYARVIPAANLVRVKFGKDERVTQFLMAATPNHAKFLKPTLKLTSLKHAIKEFKMVTAWSPSVAILDVLRMVNGHISSAPAQDAFVRFIRGLELLEALGYTHAYTARQMALFSEACGRVTSAEFLPLGGANIGKAMNAERVRLIDEVRKGFQNESR